MEAEIKKRLTVLVDCTVDSPVEIEDRVQTVNKIEKLIKPDRIEIEIKL